MFKNKEKQIIIIGGGNSINAGIETGLWNKLKNKFNIGLNYSYKYFDSTVQMFVDNKFFKDEIEGLKKLPLIIAKNHNITYTDNIIPLKTTSVYESNLENGVYKSSLTGIFALSLAIYFLQQGEIYLLGYDFGGKRINRDEKGRIITHFYQKELIHRGSGKISYYKGDRRGHRDFGCFRNIPNIKIYNVSPESQLEEFPKITYKEFYSQLHKESLSQDDIRKNIINQLKKDKHV